MSKGIDFKTYLPYIAGVLILVLIPLIYMSPVFEGKQITQFDILQYQGASSEVREYREQTGEEALWNPGMFSGMPSYQSGIQHNSNIILYVNSFFRQVFPHPTGLLFVNLLGFYILMLVLRVNPWLSIGGAVAFAMGSFAMVSIEAGHTSKINALGYVPAILAGVLLVYQRKKFWLGAAVTALFLTLHVAVNHFQVTYYLLYLLLFVVLAELYSAYKKGAIAGFAKESGILLLAATLAIGPNISKLWTTYEYAKETIRGGKSELTDNKPENSAKSRSGLDWDYAMAWSYGQLETMTLLIPNFAGGNNQMKLDRDANIAKKGIPKQYYEQAPTYWGELPFTSGPVYLGAALSFLFVFSMFLIKGAIRWWILGFSILAILLSWGKNFEAFNSFFFNYVPFYNKFRTPSMILLFLSLTFSLGAMLGLQKVLTEKLDKQQLQKYLYYALGITGGLVVLFGILMAGTYDYSGPSDPRLSQAGWPMDALQADRKAMLQSDAFRSLLFILASAALLFAFIKNIIKPKLLIAGVVILLTVDLWAVDKRFFGADSFKPERQLETRKRPSPADNAILQDKDPHYRVLNLAANTFNDAVTSFHHRSIGGYHAAKILRYQEVIENHINPSIQRLQQAMSNEPTQEKIDRTLSNLPVLNMLNTKYIIYNPEANPIQNRWALGNAWFVQNVIWVNSADEEMQKLGTFEAGTEVIARENDKPVLAIDNFRYDPNASIQLTSYDPKELVYKSMVDQNASEQIAVFSEIYYEGGNDDWKVYIDGEPAEHVKVNYILRAMTVPPGEHEIKFEFVPRSFYLGSKLSLAFSLLIMLFLAFGIWKEVKGRKEAKEAA
ncbi:MAG: hypothetical protein WD334_05290 [Chitinophagales bacterium]